MVLTETCDRTVPPAGNPAARRRRDGRRAEGFSLIELVIVVVIIGIIAAIAIPRMSRGSAGATDAALSGNLSVLRNAIDLYHTEHGEYPALATFESQLTLSTNAAGTTKAEPVAGDGYVYGPYLRTMPTVPVGPNKGQKGLATIPTTLSNAPGTGIGWYYNQTTGVIKPASGDSEDVNGNPHHDY